MIRSLIDADACESVVIPFFFSKKMWSDSRLVCHMWSFRFSSTNDVSISRNMLLICT